jgi:dihydropteroate synthase
MNVQYLNIKGNLIQLHTPLVMGILNVTPDSFFIQSRMQNLTAIQNRIEQILREGGDIVDVGGYSSRPNADDVSIEEEKQRLTPVLELLYTDYQNVIVSVDTFRSDVARWAVEKYGVAIVNDISGGTLDSQMFTTVADLHVPYVLMHIKGTPQTMQHMTDYTNLIDEIIQYIAQKVKILQQLGVNDIIIDPGFGFAKNTQQNYQLLQALDSFKIFDLPLLVGVSRKRMIAELLGIPTDQCLNGTTVLNTFAILHGASILRVHDVKEAKETVNIISKLQHYD